MSNGVDGVYSAYITGREGQGFALLLFKQGEIAGADPVGFLFDGRYIEDVDGLSVSLSIKAPANVPRVQGGVTGPEGEKNDVQFHVPKNAASSSYLRVPTQHGPVNVRLVKLRDLG